MLDDLRCIFAISKASFKRRTTAMAIKFAYSIGMTWFRTRMRHLFTKLSLLRTSGSQIRTSFPEKVPLAKVGLPERGNIHYRHSEFENWKVCKKELVTGDMQASTECPYWTLERNWLLIKVAELGMGKVSRYISWLELLPLKARALIVSFVMPACSLLKPSAAVMKAS